MIISTNAGLWAYNVGDTIMFTSTKPYRLVVTGRIKHFISAFGEHVIGKEVEEALNIAMKEHNFSISEFTVAPETNPKEGLPYHEWLIEFETTPKSIEDVAKTIDIAMQSQNSYYKDLIVGKVLKPLVITTLNKNSFKKLYEKSR